MHRSVLIPVDGGYYLPPIGDALRNEIIMGFEAQLGRGALPRRGELGLLLKSTIANPCQPDGCAHDFTPRAVQLGRAAARAALLFQAGWRLQFGPLGRAAVISCRMDSEVAPGPLFFKEEVNEGVDIIALRHHITAVNECTTANGDNSAASPRAAPPAPRVDCTRLLGYLYAIIGEGQTECYLHVLARVLAHQRDAFKVILFMYGEAKEVGKTLLGSGLAFLLGISASVWTKVSPDVKKVFTGETRDSATMKQALKQYMAQAVLVLDEVGARGDMPYNRNNKAVVFSALRSHMDGTKVLYLERKETTYRVTNYNAIILTGNTGSPTDAFSCGLSPEDAGRVYPISFGTEADPDYRTRSQAAIDLAEWCKKDRERVLLEFLALMVNYASVPLSEHKLQWPVMPAVAALPAVATCDEVRRAFDANFELTKQPGDRMASAELMAVLHIRDPKELSRRMQAWGIGAPRQMKVGAQNKMGYTGVRKRKAEELPDLEDEEE